MHRVHLRYSGSALTVALSAQRVRFTQAGLVGAQYMCLAGVLMRWRIWIRNLESLSVGLLGKVHRHDRHTLKCRPAFWRFPRRSWP